jgi:hypothetical protein
MPDLKSIVRLKSHPNRTPTGRASATATRKLVNYLAFGRGRPAHQARRPQRGIWYDHRNRPISHQEMLAWVSAEGKRQAYTHQLILSVSEAQLTAQEYNQALNAGGGLFDQWRQLVHTDSAYSHAHVVAFSDEEIRVKSPLFRDWWLAVRQALDQQQQVHLTRGGVEQEAELVAELRPAAGLETHQQEPQEELGWELQP